MIFSELNRITVIPYAGIIRVRFKGCVLSPCGHPLTELLDLLHHSIFFSPPPSAAEKILLSIATNPMFISLFHIGLQRLGYGDIVLFRLVVLHDRRQGAARRQARAVQGMDEFRLLALFLAIADFCPPCLIIGKT